MKDIPKAFDSQKWENTIYEKWEETGKFKPKSDQEGVDYADLEGYTISMPPPNATGTLHLGHAVMLALEDIFVRYKRLKGFNALWVPGTDHAAIATQSVVEKKLQNEGMERPREELGRDALLEKIKEFVAGSQSTIRNQVRKIGASCDWSREKYTMDDDLNHAVNTFFERMYADGLIYHGDRIVNWDPNMQTTVADDEMEYTEETAPFYTFKYGPFEIGTARPETKFGDKYVVMHPDDKRYSEYNHGDTFDCEWINGKITATVIKDAAVDPEFGTGVMTITPCHDATDFDIAQRHNLDFEQIIDFSGKLLPVAKEFAGIHISEARPNIVKKLEEKGLLVKTEEQYVHNVAVNYRGKGMIEPQIMKQWFIDVNKQVIDWKGKKMSIKEVMQDVVTSEMIRIIPDRFEKTYFHWIDNLKDWCISRQIWWGHRIPVWFNVSAEDKKKWEAHPESSSYLLQSLGIEILDRQFGTEEPSLPGNWIQDPDTLDTWFSSALWTFSTLGWPDHTDDFKAFHPTGVLETGYDILFFWVARMILASTYCLRSDGLPEEQCIPFKDVYLHGLIRDREGKKMSKSRPETCIDPLDMIEKYGADAVRLSLVIGNTPGNDMRLYEEKIAGYRNFVNKIWNASRFVLMNLSEEECRLEMTADNIESIADKWILTKFNQIIEDVEKGIEEYRVSEAGLRVYDFFWNEFCSWYVEISKGEHQNPAVLVYILKNSLRLLHPFIPYVTEVIWKELGESDMLIGDNWPKYTDDFNFPVEANEMEMVIDVITSIRRLRAESNVDAAKKIAAVIYSDNHEVFEKKRSVIENLARLDRLKIAEKGEKPAKSMSAVMGKTEIHLPLEGMIDLAVEKERLQKEISKLSGYITGLEKKLSNKQFTANAPDDVVEKEREKLAHAQETITNLEKQISDL